MVVAEIPLWLVHSSGSKISDPNVSPTDDTQTLRAQESLALLETVGGGAKKCAIYSVDVHPEGLKFATGGGDGAVRIWSTSALFAKYSGSFSEGGAYESSDSSGGSGASGDEESPPHPLHDDAAAPTEERIEVHDLNQLVRRKKDGQTLPKRPRQQSQYRHRHDKSANPSRVTASFVRSRLTQDPRSLQFASPLLVSI